MGRAALCHPIQHQLGPRRPRRPPPARALGGEPRRGADFDQSPARGDSVGQAGAEPVPRQQSLLPQPDLPAHRGAAGRRQPAGAARAGGGRPGPQPRSPYRPRRRSGCSSRGPSRPSTPGSRGMDPSIVTGRRRAGLGGLRDVLRPRGAPRLPVENVARAGPPPGRSGYRRVRRHGRGGGVGSSITRGSGG